eukprot:TRINITY_DN40362_c0_g1_i4.p1 TRINITY_DN40362_c0_g1~~TRINITY_DN40362_c0_g1_i4.p1  ORF type:complete len:243 (-),score=37.09 TRINITY_DN40362_c0_g1_i4:38-766(-)
MTEYDKQGGELSLYMASKGFRIVDGEIVHLNKLFPDKCSKLKALIMNIPCLTSEEKKEVLINGKAKDVTRHLQVSLTMGRIAALEFKKLKKKRWSFHLYRPALSTARGRDLEELFSAKESAISNLESSWKEAFYNIKQSGLAVDISEKMFMHYLQRYAHDKIHSTMDGFLPEPVLQLKEVVCRNSFDLLRVQMRYIKCFHSGKKKKKKKNKKKKKKKKRKENKKMKKIKKKQVKNKKKNKKK